MPDDPVYTATRQMAGRVPRFYVSNEAAYRAARWLTDVCDWNITGDEIWKEIEDKEVFMRHKGFQEFVQAINMAIKDAIAMGSKSYVQEVKARLGLETGKGE